ncbi:DNA-binding transcriptional regulator, LysR family [Thiothrix eikelboomii]|uniref:DNA-binding transcriptional regulator, LysR family n=1 Tax=Thiothrix eikelboomii TaxID=92487 RepID=A0A1T4VZI4_9GAMM|nr:LysR family transcriptional regulator [Thiothrix eikelboomii]SKA70393.1 DNA-binding transcriptional regulator, LysR family [Thiothrix eikelboomii]
MDLQELRTLIKVVQTGSFTQAAILLGSHKAHVSRTITQLEAKLGVRLLARSTRALRLTEIGREVFERAVGIIAAVDDTERVAQQMWTEPRGILRITCGTEFGMMVVSQWINQFLLDYPQITIEAEFTGRLVDLVHEGFDLAIRIGSLDDTRLVARRLGMLEYGLFANPAYLQRRGIPKHPEQLTQHDLLIFSGGQVTGTWSLTKASETIIVPLVSRLRLNNRVSLMDAALHGLGIVRLPWLLAQTETKQGQLSQVLEEWTMAQIPVHAVFPSNRYLTPKVRAFVDHAVQNFITLTTSVSKTPP